MAGSDQQTSANEAERLRNQRAVLARFGGQALRAHDLDALLQEATKLVSQAIEVDLVKVLQLLPDGETMLLRAGVNWNPGVVGHATLGANQHSPAGYALQTDEAVISPDLATEDRFKIPDLLKEHGVRSMVNVVIRTEGPAWGVLEVDARRPRRFDEDDISFLQNYANLLAGAIHRLRSDKELAEALERQKSLADEVQHRSKNLLSNIRALARRTCATSADMDEFETSFDARLRALGRTQSLLAQGAENSIGLHDLIRLELDAHGVSFHEKVLVSGPHVNLPPRHVQALAMAFHELTANAAKYGALQQHEARLSITWTVRGHDDEKEVLIRWAESGVPIPTAPSRSGFGSETIERMLPYTLGGDAELRFTPGGVECDIRFPRK